MNRRIATTTLAAAIGFAVLAPVVTARADDTTEKCYGIAAKGKNDCAAGAHSCAGQATKDRDPASFVALPKGACAKIQGGTTKA